MPYDPPSPLSSAQLVAQLATGDELAAEEIFNRYVQRLIDLAGTRLAAKLAVRVDPEDIVMSAFRSFFVAARDGRFVITEGADLWRLLAEVVLHKLYRTAERHLAKRRSVDRQQPITDTSNTDWQPPSPEPTPDEAVAAVEELTAVLAELSDRDRQIIELRLQGYEHREIAQRLKSSERTVRRSIQAARRQILVRGGKGFVPSAALRRPRSSRPKGQRSPTALSQLAAPLKLVDFTLQRQIGAGATGRVYRALDRRNNKQVAIKFLRKALIGNAAAIASLVRESAVVANLRHPAIVAVHGAGATRGGAIFLVMDHVDGLDLAKVSVQGSVDVGLGVRWMLQAAEAIDFAHRRNVIHCDLKPSNILLGKDGKIWVTDFGLAVSDLHRPQNVLAGTPAFMAPEQVDAKWGAISSVTDVWGLGSVLYFLLFSKPPHEGPDVLTTLAQVSSNTPIILPPSDASQVPEPVLEVLRRCLAKTQADRFATIRELMSALTTLSGQLPGPN